MSTPTAAACRRCTHFVHDAQAWEGVLPGLRAMGSGYASVRGDDGLCALHERFVAARSACEQFALAAATERRVPETPADGCG